MMMLSHAVRAHENGLPVRTHLLLFQERYTPKSAPDRILSEAGDLTQELRVNVVKLWEAPASEALESNREALYPRTALMGATVAEQRHAAARVRKTGRRSLAMQMALLGALRYGSREAFFERIGKMLLSREILRQSPLWKEIETEARTKGLKAGKSAGRAEGRQIGLLEGERRVLTRVIRVRFGAVPAWAEKRLREADRKTLDKWTERVITAASLRDALK